LVLPDGGIVREGERQYGQLRSEIVMAITNAPSAAERASSLYRRSYRGFGPYGDFRVILSTAIDDFFNMLSAGNHEAVRLLHRTIDPSQIDQIRALDDLE
jgi:hypothetical protein